MEKNTNVPAPFNPSQVMETLKEKIKTTFLAMLPEETLEVMIKTEIDAFFEPAAVTRKYTMESKDKSSYWGEKIPYCEEIIKESPFRRVVWDYCLEETAKALRNTIDDNYFYGRLGADKELIHQNMTDVFEKVGPKMINSFFQGIFFNNAGILRNDILRELNNIIKGR